MRWRGSDGLASEGGYTGDNNGRHATGTEKWRKAEELKIHGMVKNCAFKHFDRPKDNLVVGAKMLYKIKIGQAGEVGRFKCRPVAQGVLAG